MTFEELGLREEVLKSLKELGFEAIDSDPGTSNTTSTER